MSVVVDDLRQLLEGERALVQSRNQEIRALRETTDVLGSRLMQQESAAIQSQRIADLEAQMEADGSRNERILRRLQQENEKLDNKNAEQERQIEILQQRIADDANQRARDRARTDERLADKEHKLQEVLREARVYQEQMTVAMREGAVTPEKYRHQETENRAQREQLRSHVERIEALEDKVTSLQKELAESVQERRTAKEDLSVALQDARELREEMNEAQSQLLRANALRQQTALELAKAHEQIGSMRTDHAERLKHAQTQPRKEQSSLEKDIEIDSLQTELSLVKKEIFMLQCSQEGTSSTQEAELDDLRARVKVLRESVVSGEREIDRLKAELEHEMSRVESGSGELERLRTDNESLNRKAAHLEVKLLQKERECHRLNQELLEVSAQVDVLSTSTSGPSQREVVLNNKLSNLLEAASQDRADYEEAIAQRDGRIEELQRALSGRASNNRSVM